MGCVYTFICPRCEYQAHVAGKIAEGLHCVTQTIACDECKIVRDVTLKLRVTEVPEAETRILLTAKPDFLPPMLLHGKPQRTKWLEFKPTCPMDAAHRIGVWTSPGKCPRCGIFMEQDGIPYRIWD